MGTGFQSFMGGFVRHWLATMTGSAIALLIAGAGAYFGGQLWWVFALLGVLALVPAAYFVWKDERVKVLELERRLRPTIDVYLDAESRGIRSVPERKAEGTPYFPADWIQVTVASKTDASLEDCEVAVVSFEGTDFKDAETVWCNWSNHADGVKRIEVRPGAPQAANLLSFHHRRNRMALQLIPAKHWLLEKIQSPGIFTVKIAVSAKNAITVHKTAKINWTGRPAELAITLE